jgi:hypothetical protein
VVVHRLSAFCYPRSNNVARVESFLLRRFGRRGGHVRVESCSAAPQQHVIPVDNVPTECSGKPCMRALIILSVHSSGHKDLRHGLLPRRLVHASHFGFEPSKDQL